MNRPKQTPSETIMPRSVKPNIEARLKPVGKRENTMSKNNQLLVKEHKGKFYVFEVMAESWIDEGQQVNRLELKEAKNTFDTRKEAHYFAHKLDTDDEWGGSEYGVVDEVLYKDDAPVQIVDAPTT